MVTGTADHIGNDHGARRVARCIAGADAAVAHDDDTIRDGEYFGKPVADENDGHAALRQKPHAVEQSLSFAFGQGSGWFIENEQIDLLRQSARDQSQLLGGEIQHLHRLPRIDIKSEVTQGRGRPCHAQGMIEQSPPDRLGIQEEIFGHREFGRNVDFLRNKGHARCLGFGDACGRIGSSGKRDASGIAAGSMQTGKDLDECGLPGAVLSEKGDDLARFDDETDIIDRDDTGKFLRQMVGSERSAARIIT